MSEKPIDIRERALRFTCDVFDYCEVLAVRVGMSRHIAYQLFAAASSIGANLEEAKAGYSRRDFTAKTAISLKECREAKYWLRVADATALGPSGARNRLLAESDELVAILTVSIRRLQPG